MRSYVVRPNRCSGEHRIHPGQICDGKQADGLRGNADDDQRLEQNTDPEGRTGHDAGFIGLECEHEAECDGGGYVYPQNLGGQDG